MTCSAGTVHCRMPVLIQVQSASRLLESSQFIWMGNVMGRTGANSKGTACGTEYQRLLMSSHDSILEHISGRRLQMSHIALQTCCDLVPVLFTTPLYDARKRDNEFRTITTQGYNCFRDSLCMPLGVRGQRTPSVINSHTKLPYRGMQ